MVKVVRLVPSMALAASLCVLAGATLATSTSAQDRRNRDRAPAAPAAPATPPITRPFAVAYQPINTAITALNWDAADAALPALRAVATTPYEKFVAGQSAYRIAIGRHSVPLQLAAAEEMLASQGTPAANLAGLLLATTQLSYNAASDPAGYAKSANYAQQAIAAGSTEPNLAVLHVDALFRSGQIEPGLAAARSHIAAARANHTLPSDAIYGIAARALNEADRQSDFMQITVERVGDYPTANNYRTACLAILQNMNDDRGKALDTLQVMQLAGAMNNRRFYLEYVGDLVEGGLPKAALVAIQAGQASNIIPPTDTTFNEIIASQTPKLREDQDSLDGSARRAAANPAARFSVKTGDSYASYDRFVEAEAQYNAALAKSDVDADLANTRLGIVRVRAGNYQGALDVFAMVTHDPVRIQIAQLWAGYTRTRMAEAAAPATTPAAPPAQ